MTPRSNKQVFVVDYDSRVREQCCAMLAGEGFDVREGATRQDALSLLDESIPDVIIIGVFLPDGPGYLLFEDPRLASVAVVGLTDVFQGPTVRHLLKEEHAFIELLDKPLSGANLIDLMRVHFGADYPDSRMRASVDDANRVDPEAKINEEVTSVTSHPQREDEEVTQNSSELFEFEESVVEKFPRGNTSPKLRPVPNTNVPEVLDWRSVGEKGSLARTGFATVMAYLANTRHTGSVRLWRQRVRKIVYVDAGRPVSVRSNLLFECLGNMLVREGIIDQATNEATVERAQQEGKRQGEVLIAGGHIDDAQLKSVLKRQLSERLLDVFGWSDGQFAVHEVSTPYTTTPFKLDETLSLVIRGIMERVPIERIINELSGCYSIEMQLDSTDSRIDTLGFESSHYEVIEDLKDGGTLLELVARHGQSSQVYQIVYALVVLGLVTFS